MIWLTAVLGAYALWALLGMVLPWRLPDALSIIVMTGFAYGLLIIPVGNIRLALAATTTAMVLHRAILRYLPGAGVPPSPPVRPRLPRRHENKTGTAFVPAPRPRGGRRVPEL